MSPLPGYVTARRVVRTGAGAAVLSPYATRAWPDGGLDAVQGASEMPTKGTNLTQPGELQSFAAIPEVRQT